MSHPKQECMSLGAAILLLSPRCLCRWRMPPSSADKQPSCSLKPRPLRLASWPALHKGPISSQLPPDTAPSVSTSLDSVLYSLPAFLPYLPTQEDGNYLEGGNIFAMTYASSKALGMGNTYNHYLKIVRQGVCVYVRMCTHVCNIYMHM